MSYRVLVIEDQREIANLVKLHLHDIDCQVKLAFDGTAGLADAEANHYDLIILDLMLPGENGLEICRRLRARADYTPILMLTSRASELDRVLGLEMGADDYLTKPFSVLELLARVKAIFRRVKAMAAGTMTATSTVQAGDLIIDVQKRLVTLSGTLDRPDREGVRPVAASRAESGPGLHARPASGFRLGLQPQRLRTYGQFAYQPSAQQDRGRPGEPRLRQNGLGRRIQILRDGGTRNHFAPSLRRCVHCCRRGRAMPASQSLWHGLFSSPKSLHVKFFILIAVLVCANCGLALILQARTYRHYDLMLTQALNQSLAANLAAEHFAELPHESGFMTKVKSEFSKLMAINPNIEIYLLDADGRIKAFTAPPRDVVRQRVDVAPLHAFIRNDFVLPLLDDDPKDRDAKKIFSAAYVEPTNPSMGFLYVILGGSEYDAVAQRVAKRHAASQRSDDRCAWADRRADGCILCSVDADQKASAAGQRHRHIPEQRLRESTPGAGDRRTERRRARPAQLRLQRHGHPYSNADGANRRHQRHPTGTDRQYLARSSDALWHRCAATSKR